MLMERVYSLFLYFQIFLNENCAAEDLMCWLDIEAFRAIPAVDKAVRNLKAKHLRKQYFTKNYYFGSNSPASKEAQRQTVLAGGNSSTTMHLPARPRTPVFREAQKHVRASLEKVWLVQFMNTPGIMERHKGILLSKAANSPTTF